MKSTPAMASLLLFVLSARALNLPSSYFTTVLAIPTAPAVPISDGLDYATSAPTVTSYRIPVSGTSSTLVPIVPSGTCGPVTTVYVNPGGGSQVTVPIASTVTGVPFPVSSSVDGGSQVTTTVTAIPVPSTVVGSPVTITSSIYLGPAPTGTSESTTIISYIFSSVPIATGSSTSGSFFSSAPNATGSAVSSSFFSSAPNATGSAVSSSFFSSAPNATGSAVSSSFFSSAPNATGSAVSSSFFSSAPNATVSAVSSSFFSSAPNATGSAASSSFFSSAPIATGSSASSSFAFSSPIATDCIPDSSTPSSLPTTTSSPISSIGGDDGCGPSTTYITVPVGGTLSSSVFGPTPITTTTVIATVPGTALDNPDTPVPTSPASLSGRKK